MNFFFLFLFLHVLSTLFASFLVCVAAIATWCFVTQPRYGLIRSSPITCTNSGGHIVFTLLPLASFRFRVIVSFFSLSLSRSLPIKLIHLWNIDNNNKSIVIYLIFIIAIFVIGYRNHLLHARIFFLLLCLFLSLAATEWMDGCMCVWCVSLRLSIHVHDSNQLLIIHAWWMFVICFHFPFVCCSNCEIFSLLFGCFSHLFLFLFGKFETLRSCSHFSFGSSFFLFFLSSRFRALCCCYYYCLCMCVLFFVHCHRFCCLSFSSLSLFMFIHCLRIMAINWYAKWELIMSSVRFYFACYISRSLVRSLSRWSNQNPE